MNVCRTQAVATLGETLRRRRRDELKIIGAEAAAMIGCSQPNYSDWENDKVKPDDRWLDGIAKFLGVDRRTVVLLRSGETVQDVADELAEVRERLARIEAVLKRQSQGSE